MTDEDETPSFSEVKRNWVKENLKSYGKPPDISQLFARYNALAGRLNPELDNEH